MIFKEVAGANLRGGDAPLADVWPFGIFAVNVPVGLEILRVTLAILYAGDCVSDNGLTSIWLSVVNTAPRLKPVRVRRPAESHIEQTGSNQAIFMRVAISVISLTCFCLFWWRAVTA